MKIKHFAGYGSVQAKKTATHKNKDITTVTIVVSGNHEQGLGYRYDDKDSITRWLAPRFIKDLTDNRQIVALSIKDDYVIDKDGEHVKDQYGNWIEERTYTVSYAPTKEIAYGYM